MQILDHEKKIIENELALKQLKDQNQKASVWSEQEIKNLEDQLEKAKKEIYQNLTSMDRVAISRHAERPKALDYITNLFTQFEEIHGDRLFRDDHAIVCGLGYLGSQKCVVIAQEKGSDTESRLERNFGMTYPEGYRKALRVMKLAEKFDLPIITFVDTPGAYPGLEAEERGQGWAIAENLKQMSTLTVPIVSILIGEGCSGGALGIAVADRVIMLEHAYYSVISPEGCSSILWKDPSCKDLAAKALKLHPEDLLPLGIIDGIIEEPLGGAHLDPASLYQRVQARLVFEVQSLLDVSKDDLIETRYQKYRKIGKFIED
jgi:acetyl-CoA carboxylase carboxyl transferase subunit alpha